MKVAFLSLIIIFITSCARNSGQYDLEIEKAIKEDQAIKDHDVKSIRIITQKDSTLTGWYVVDYSAILDNGKKITGHLVFSKTGDDHLAR